MCAFFMCTRRVLKVRVVARCGSTAVGEALLPHPHRSPGGGPGRGDALPESHRAPRVELLVPPARVGRVARAEVRCLFFSLVFAADHPGRLPKPHRDQLHAAYNAHMLHSSSADPFKLALYKLMGKIDPARRSVAQVTVTTEDWLWFQLAMVSALVWSVVPI